MRLPQSKIPGMLVDPGKVYLSFIIALSQSDMTNEELAACARQVMLSLIDGAAPDDKPESPSKLMLQILEYAQGIERDQIQP